MSTPIPPLVPRPDDDGDIDAVPHREVDGEKVLDTDVDADQVDGATADRLAAEQPADADTDAD
ncbi:hypothetical protein FQ142_07145 [Microbacterium sp. ANT_H45B]|uniref:hypothetical protein n=1 Tax=Microbacterium sp. ANT_H45B TaxID=2597346 RepID=UPI0011EE4D14|nr:hypothetical protein [Microbacterium sp. ANT_H45B]KAA0960664.1 hypothetical protein FQ142_07145 [Microbacterium sp. ANT_H45B]